MTTTMEPKSNKELTEDEAALRGLRSESEYLEKYGFHFSDENYTFRSRPGIDAEIVAEISHIKDEPAWMTDYRLRAYEIFQSKPMPTWGGDLSKIKFEDIFYYVRATDTDSGNWDDVPDDIKETFDRLGIPEAERQFLSGAGAQYESEVVYHNIQKHLSDQGVIFLSMDEGLRQHPELFREYFGTIIPSSDNKFAALNSAVWSGGSFIYVPPGIDVGMPLQAYFRINTQSMGQFERTLIIVDEGAKVHYVEGCLPAGEQVSMGDRWVNIESIRPGDNVLDSNGVMGRVQKVMTRPFKGDLIKIHPLSDANTFQLTPEHPVLAVKREKVRIKRNARKDWLPEVDSAKLIGTEPEFVPAGQLERGDFLVFPICQVVEDNHHFTPEVMQLLGYYLAEGSAYVHNKLNQHVVSFSFNMHEREDIETVKALIKIVAGKDANEITQEKRTSTEVRVYSQKLYDLVLENCGKLAANKVISKVVMELPPEKQAHLLHGYLRGDGSTYQRKNTMVRAATVSQALAWQLQEIIARQGHYATINIRPGGDDMIGDRKITRQDQYIIYYSPDKQQSEVRKTDDYFLVPVKQIERIPHDGPVFNFEMTSDPNAYLVRGFAVHNCTAPIYSKDSLHSAVVEIVVKKGGNCRYTTIQNWSNNVYNLVTKRAVAYQDATMSWVDANLGCLAEGSTVTTPEGIKAIEDLNVGDLVLSYDEHQGALCFREVKAKRYSGEQPIHKVSIGERQLQVTANHPFYSYTHDGDTPKKLGRYQLAYVRADHLKEAIIPRTSIDYGVPYALTLPELSTTMESKNQYAEQLTMVRDYKPRLLDVDYTTDDIMWMFGYWVGDGDIQIKMGKTEGVVRWAKVGFSTPAMNRARPQLMSVMNGIIDAQPTERADGVHLARNSKELAELFRLNGFEGKATTKRVPSWVWSLPESQRLAFVAGYLDADGTVANRRLSLKSANRGLLEDIASLLVTLGITSRLYTEFSEPRTVQIMGNEAVAHGSYRLTFAPDERLFPYLSSNLVERATEAIESLQQVRGRTVGRSNIALSDDVEVMPVTVSEASAELVPTWDIEVEGTGNFVSQGFIVHNSQLTMKYPAVHMMEPGAHGEILSIAFAGKGQHQDAGGKVVHHAPHTTSRIISKSISKDGGRASYRGLLKVEEGAFDVRSNVVCDALLLDEASRSDTYPYIEVDEKQVTIGHEASVSKIGEEQLFYLMSRGLNEEQANAMIVNGFIEPLAKELPMEYSIELRKLIEIQLEGSIG